MRAAPYQQFFDVEAQQTQETPLIPAYPQRLPEAFQQITVYNANDRCPLSHERIEDIPEENRVLFPDGYVYVKDYLLRYLAARIQSNQKITSPMNPNLTLTLTPPDLLTLFSGKSTVDPVCCLLGSAAFLAAFATMIVLSYYDQGTAGTAVGASALGIILLTAGYSIYRCRRQNQADRLLAENPPLIYDTSEETLLQLELHYKKVLLPFNREDFVYKITPAENPEENTLTHAP